MAKLSLSKAVLVFAMLTLIYSDYAIPLNPQDKPTNQPTKNTILSTLTQKSFSSSKDESISPFFYNFRGSNTTDQQIASFKEYVNFASAFYRYDGNARLSYVSNRMNETHGVNNNGFSVVLLNSSSDWATTFASFQVYAGLQPGSDTVFPQASYMFIRDGINSGRKFFSRVGDKGSGIDSSLQNVINNIIFAAQGSLNSCYCPGRTDSIYDYLRSFDGGYWNVFCSNTLNLYLSVYPKDDKYILTKPNKCYYAIYRR